MTAGASTPSRRLTREAAVAFFAALYRGEHHIPAPGHYGAHGVRLLDGSDAYYVNQYDELASYDYDMLTRLVLLAHEYAVRVDVDARGRYLRITIHGRLRDGLMHERHPTIEQAIATFREARHDALYECRKSFATLERTLAHGEVSP